MTLKMIRSDESFMRIALNLAKRGMGFTNPNPMVGAIIVKNGRIIGKGYHTRCGAPHAEIEAIRSLADPESAKGATIYVTLEPCSTYGRTPPCSNAIIEHGFARVVIGSVDPNPAHSGRAAGIFREHGIQVTTGVLNDKCAALNTAFFKWITHKTPFVILKMAQTLDGRTATENGISKWITSAKARERVMKLRLMADAIMCGRSTYELDTPSMTARATDGHVIKTPRRIVVTSHPETLKIRDTWETVALPCADAWKEYLTRLGSENVTLLLIEGGGKLAASALRAGVVDLLEFHIAPKILGGLHSRPSVAGPDPESLEDAITIQNMQITKCGCDFIASGHPLIAGKD